MGEIVVAGQTFEIKGDNPTPQEQVAIDTFLQARNLDDEQTGIADIDDGRVFLTPDQILTEAQKGKYNKDTESFLASPTFKRIVTEVGLSIAGGIAGAALAPFSGGSSLALTATMAARVARLARPLINISNAQVGKIGRATVGAALGGGSGAAIAQSFDPKEDIVKEVARGALQGGFGEVLGFGMAGALGKVYNKVAGQKIQMIKGGRAAAQTILRQKAYYSLLEKAAAGEKITDDLIAKTQSKLGKEMSKEQIKILKDPKLASRNADALMTERGADFFKRVEKGTLTPALVTENNMIDTLEGIIGASFFGGGKMLTSKEGARLGLLGSMDEFTESVMTGVDRGLLDPGTLGMKIQQGVANSHLMYNRILTNGYKKLSPAIREATEQVVNGKIIPKPGYGIDLSWKGVRKNYVYNSTTKQNEDAISLFSLLQNEGRRLSRYRQQAAVSDAVNLVDELKTMKRISTVDEVLTEYRTLSRTLASGGGSPEFQQVGRAIQKVLKAEIDKAKVPANIRAEMNKLSNLNQMGPKLFNVGIFHRIAKYDTGQKAILDQILVKGTKNDVATDFFNKLDMTDTGIIAGQKGAGKRLLDEKEANLLKDAVRGQFIKRFINDSTEIKDQYLFLRADKARNFVERDFANLINDSSFLKPQQAAHMKEFASALKFADGAITSPGAKSGRGRIFIQLKEAGALTQLGAVAAGYGGVIDPGAATAFVIAPWALSRVFTNPKLFELLINGVKGQPRNFEQFSRFMNQLGTGLVSNGIVSEEQNSMVQRNIKVNEENYRNIYAGKLPNDTFFEKEDTFSPEAASAIPVEINQPRARTNYIPPNLPNVQPSNLPLGGQNQSNLQLAQALNLFNKGGIVDAKKVNQ
jgi:hypothetical protein